MKRWLLIVVLSVLAFLAVATGVIALTGADLAVSVQFCREGTWPVGDLLFWQMLYRLDRIPSISLCIVSMVPLSALLLSSLLNLEGKAVSSSTPKE